MCDLQTYRQRIGAIRREAKSGNCGKGTCLLNELNVMIWGVICMILLLIGGIELNPGPISNDQFMEIQEQIKEIVKNLMEIKNEISMLKKTVGEKICQVEINCVNLGNKVNKLEEQIGAKSNTIIGEKDQTNRRNNLIIFGIPEKTNERKYQTKEALKEFIVKGLQFDIDDADITNAYRIGKHWPRPIFSKFQNTSIKDEIFSKRYLLKGTGCRMDFDFNENVRKTRIMLAPFLMLARRAKCNAYMKSDKLFINGTERNLEYCRKHFGNIHTDKQTKQQESINSNSIIKGGDKQTFLYKASRSRSRTSDADTEPDTMERGAREDEGQTEEVRRSEESDGSSGQVAVQGDTRKKKSVIICEVQKANDENASENLSVYSRAKLNLANQLKINSHRKVDSIVSVNNSNRANVNLNQEEKSKMKVKENGNTRYDLRHHFKIK